MGIQRDATTSIVITQTAPALSEGSKRRVNGAYPHRTEDHGQLTSKRALRRLILPRSFPYPLTFGNGFEIEG